MFARVLALPLLSSLLTLNAYADIGPACRPDYQVQHQACKLAPEVVGFSRQVLVGEVVNHGACELPDPDQLCRDHALTIGQRFPGATNFSFANVRTRELFQPPRWNGRMLCHPVDVLCDVTFDVPAHRRVSEDSCPVENIREANGCFERANLTIDASATVDCLNLKVVTEADQWKKAVCLHDLDLAVRRNALALTLPDFSTLQDQLVTTMENLRANVKFAGLSQLFGAR